MAAEEDDDDDDANVIQQPKLVLKLFSSAIKCMHQLFYSASGLVHHIECMHGSYPVKQNVEVNFREAEASVLRYLPQQ